LLLLSAMQASPAGQRDGARPPVSQMTAFIEDYRGSFGVGPICRVLPIAPATYYARVAVMRDPELASDRTKSDVIDCEDIERAFEASGKRYGARKVWHALRREGKDVARCTGRFSKNLSKHGNSPFSTILKDFYSPCWAWGYGLQKLQG